MARLFELWKYSFVAWKSFGVTSDTNHGKDLACRCTVFAIPAAIKNSARQRSVTNSNPALSRTISTRPGHVELKNQKIHVSIQSASKQKLRT